MKRMTLIPTRAGLAYECRSCKEVMVPAAADTHECPSVPGVCTCGAFDSVGPHDWDCPKRGGVEVASDIYERLDMMAEGRSGSVQDDLAQLTSQSEWEDYFQDDDPTKYL